MLNDFKDIMEHFGVPAQMKKLNEECFEFLEAVDNYEDLVMFQECSEHDLNLARDFIIEELGDVLLLLTQFIARYNIKQEELDPFMDYKLKRTLDRINSGFYDKKDE